MQSSANSNFAAEDLANSFPIGESSAYQTKETLPQAKMTCYLIAMFNKRNMRWHVAFILGASLIILNPSLARLVGNLTNQGTAVLTTICTPYLVSLSILIYEKLKFKREILKSPYLLFLLLWTLEVALFVILSANSFVAIGSDGPMNLFLNIMLASIHPARPSEAITREQAVKAYTFYSAYAEFAEQEKGTLTSGKLADLTVLSQDIFTVPVPELPKTQSILTIVGGKIVHDAKVLK